MGADAHDDVLTASLRRLREERRLTGPLEVDGLKLSHHGSKHNTTRQLLHELSASNYLISTNGSRFDHPDSLTIKTIIKAPGLGPADAAPNYGQDRLAALANDQRLRLKLDTPSRVELDTI